MRANGKGGLDVAGLGWMLPAPIPPVLRDARAGRALGLGAPAAAALACLVAACGGSPGPATEARADPDRTAAGRPEVEPRTSDDAYAERYRALRDLVAGPVPEGPALARIRADLGEIANAARDRHLRANAAVLLASIEERAGRIDAAVAQLRHARALVPDDAGPAMALAVTLGRAGRFAEAAEAMAAAAALDPDNLENWLLLGEFRTKAGDEDGAVEAYAAYELRRKGLLDGLTLKTKDGGYARGPAERAACARALAAATDQGTARGLLYALATEPDPTVRRAVVEAMAIARLADFLAPLRRALASERDPAVREAIEAAVAAIEAAPVAPAPAASP